MGDETLCLGFGVKPMTSAVYDNSKNLWVVRAYNGSWARAVAAA